MVNYYYYFFGGGGGLNFLFCAKFLKIFMISDKNNLPGF